MVWHTSGPSTKFLEARCELSFLLLAHAQWQARIFLLRKELYEKSLTLQPVQADVIGLSLEPAQGNNLLPFGAGVVVIIAPEDESSNRGTLRFCDVLSPVRLVFDRTASLLLYASGIQHFVHLEVVLNRTGGVQGFRV